MRQNRRVSTILLFAAAASAGQMPPCYGLTLGRGPGNSTVNETLFVPASFVEPALGVRWGAGPSELDSLPPSGAPLGVCPGLIRSPPTARATQFLSVP